MDIYNNVGKIVGRLKDGIYYSNRKKEHFMVKFGGFGISREILEELKKEGCYHICIVYTREDLTVHKYACSLDDYMNSKKIYNNYGDIQHFVSIKDMNNTEENR